MSFFRIILLLILPLSCISTLPSPSLCVSTCENAQDRIGESSYTVILGLLTIGDGSITTAMNSVKIDSVHHVDIQTCDYLIFKNVRILVIGSGRGPGK